MKKRLIDMLDLLKKTTSEMDQTLPKEFPYVKTNLEGVEARFLVDTDTEVSVVSDHLLNKLMILNDRVPTLPVTKIMMNGDFPNQTTKVKRDNGKGENWQQRGKCYISSVGRIT